MWEKGSAAVAGFEDGGRGHQPRQVATSRRWQRQGSGFFPRSLQKELSPANTLIAQ